MATIEETLKRLEGSKFRAGFKLNEKDKEYISEKGMDTIEAHARDFVKDRLSAAYPENDGRQTPMKGHPVFKAMHATACCCRGCLYKWYRVEKGVPLSDVQQEKIVRLLLSWIRKQNADNDK